MSVDIRLTEDGDIYNQNSFIRGYEEVIQSVIIRMERHRGEWILDETVGIPYVEWFGVKVGVTNETIEDLIRAELLDVRGVLAVRELAVEKRDRTYVLEAVIDIEDETADDAVTTLITSVAGAARWRVL